MSIIGKISFPVVFILLFFSSSTAQVLVDHQYMNGLDELNISPVFSFSEIEYEGDGRGEFDIDRTLFGVSLGYGIHPSFDLFGDLAYIAEAELENSSRDGDGFLMGHLRSSTGEARGRV